MRVVLVSPEYPPADYLGGIGTHTAAVAPALARHGHEVCVVTRGEAGEVIEDGVRVLRLNGEAFRDALNAAPAIAEGVIRILTRRVRGDAKA